MLHVSLKSYLFKGTNFSLQVSLHPQNGKNISPPRLRSNSYSSLLQYWTIRVCVAYANLRKPESSNKSWKDWKKIKLSHFRRPKYRVLLPNKIIFLLPKRCWTSSFFSSTMSACVLSCPIMTIMGWTSIKCFLFL